MVNGDKSKGRKTEKNIRIEFQLPQWLIPAIEEYQYDNDIPGSRQMVILSMLKMASRVNTLRKKIRSNPPKVLEEIRNATDNNELIEIIFGKNIGDYELGVLMSSIETVRDIRQGKVRV